MNTQEAINIISKHIPIMYDYLLKNARPGETCRGEYVERLLKNFAAYLEKNDTAQDEEAK